MNEFYELKIIDADAWVRHSNEDSIYFTKEKISNATLLLERLYPYESGYLYTDFITGRQVVIESNDSASLIIPSRIFVPNVLSKISKEEILQKSFDILDNDELNYLNISEDILYNSAFCEIISKRDNTQTIPISLVKEEIEKYKSRTRKRTKSE